MGQPPSLPSGPRTIRNGWRWDKCEPKHIYIKKEIGVYLGELLLKGVGAGVGLSEGKLEVITLRQLLLKLRALRYQALP